MTEKPLVSVIVPAYNHDRFIAETIQSVLTQTFAHFELLILDDGSTDNTWQVIEKFAHCDRRIKCWRQDNVGLVQTLNNLMDQTKAPFVALMGSDDVWLPQRLEWGIDDMCEDSALSATFCSYLICDKDLKPIRCPYGAGLPRAIKGAELVKHLIPHNYVGALTGFMRADAVRKAGRFARNFEACQDWDLWLRLSMQGPLNLRPDIGALYRWHGENMSASNKTTVRAEAVTVLEEMSPMVARHYGLDDNVMHALALQTARAALSARRPRSAVKALIERSKKGHLGDEGNVLLLLSLALAKETAQAKKLSHHLEKNIAGMPQHILTDFRSISSNIETITF